MFPCAFGISRSRPKPKSPLSPSTRAIIAVDTSAGSPRGVGGTRSFSGAKFPSSPIFWPRSSRVTNASLLQSAMFSYLKNVWPFYWLKVDDLKESNRIVNKLSIPEQVKQFVFAIRDPDSHVVVYILAAQNLSEQSAIDADRLIKEVRPNAVVVSVAPSALSEILVEEKCSSENQNHIPTSSLGVLKKCFFEKIKREQYDSFAGCQVLRAIFGIGFYGHFLAAQRAAEAVDSHFLLLESPYDNARFMNTSTNSETGNESSTLHLQTNQLLPGMVTTAVYSSSRRFSVPDGLHSEMVQSLIPCLDLLFSRSMSDSVAFQDQEDTPRCNYQVPAFAQSFYSLLVELHQIFIALPAIGKALSSVQKMIVDVNEGKSADTQTLSEAQNFRLAIEGLRIALNKAARRPVDELNSNSSRVQFCDLPTEEKCHVLFAQALKSQAGKFGTVVAVVDAASLAGLRRHWKTCVPPEVAELANHCFTHFCDEDLDNDDEIMNNRVDKKKILTDKPVVALGAGATAVFGVSSLSKAIPASSLIKVATFHLPASLKVGLIQLQRTVAVGLSKMLVPSKLLAPGLTTGAKSSTLTLTASTEKIRAVTHSLITTAERTSLLAIRTSFYEIMRRRHVRPVRFVPWASFACSMGACTGLLMYGDGIECAAESFPSVPMIASLGRGLQSLQQASQEVKRTSSAKIHEALHTLVQYVKRS